MNYSYNLTIYNATHTENSSVSGYYYIELMGWNSSTNVYEVKEASTSNGNYSMYIDNLSVQNSLGETLFSSYNYSALSQLNKGNSSGALHNPRINAGVSYTTAMGSFTADKLNESYSYLSNYINATYYVDQKSGLPLFSEIDTHYISENTTYSTYTGQLTSTNINTTLTSQNSGEINYLYIAGGVAAIAVVAIVAALVLRRRKSS